MDDWMLIKNMLDRRGIIYNTDWMRTHPTGEDDPIGGIVKYITIHDSNHADDRGAIRLVFDYSTGILKSIQPEHLTAVPYHDII